jgi:mycoketide-CoA synthase
LIYCQLIYWLVLLLHLPYSTLKHHRIEFAGNLIVTGGLGGLGLLVAMHHAGAVNGSIILLGRNAMTATYELRKLSTVTATLITSQKSDAACTSDMQCLSGMMAGSGTRVVHAAGTIADSSMYRQSADSLKAPLAAKLASARHLHHIQILGGAAENIAFGSLAGTLGSKGQYNYSSANSALESFYMSGRVMVGIHIIHLVKKYPSYLRQRI